ncbi:uncharacterized protein LOC127804079 [Diospyros lotus]|uniref:uncharacterized protein LOC127804079 n=1 Tax=Diospyros lotus TaxID=55363 RepID=UPI00224FA63E|nr:uncharacterized protein LOC127804079 [Diospyros lotus]
METPSSTRRVTRSQTLASANRPGTNNNIPMSRKVEDSEKGVSKSRKQQDRSALIDITNDSPIVGIAMASLETPLSTIAKKKNSEAKQAKTPGSGEALLRGQVKTLLQKVEEEAELSKISLEQRPFFHLQGFVNSPMGLLAPTPANTPYDLNLSDDESFKNNCLASVTPSPVQEQLEISQMVTEIFDPEKSLITRSLLLDFSEKSEGSDSSSSVVTHEGGESEGKEKSSSMEDDNESVWSIQVNASSRDEEEEEDEEVGIEETGEVEEEYENDDGGLVDELCEGIRRISVNGEKNMTKFSGKHIRFVYNSEDEIEGEEECEAETEASAGVLRLKGLPMPKGKHFRFPEAEDGLEEEEEDC